MTLCIYKPGEMKVVVLNTPVGMFSEMIKHRSYKLLLHIESFGLLNLN